MTLPLGLAAAAGLAVWLAVGFISGRREAWDSSLYFMAGIPVMCLIAFALAYRFPTRSWILALAIAFGLAFGLGGRDVAGELTRSWYESSVATADRVKARIESEESKESTASTSTSNEPRPAATPARASGTSAEPA